MDTGAGEDRADWDLPVGGIQMQFVASPPVQVSLAIHLRPDVAAPRQLFEHFGQRLEALPLDPGATLGGFGAGEGALGLGLFALPGFGSALGLGVGLVLGFPFCLGFDFGFGAPLLLGLLLLLFRFFVRLLFIEDGLWDTLPGWDGRGVAGDVADEPLTLRGGDHGGM
eukprot:TRINITY_DN13025_c0_g1_i6.p1 TRINITY_DN13025_c0_g1~~TRINITY_DN13025_c0_g1_i6.p1  ORF type:complete len:168 (-),score=29.24 TRINITY_DN13025_c0_g1_i6:225-728(-)